MTMHSKGEFEKFISQLRKTNVTLDFYSDFGKISQNVDSIALSLTMLNYLLGKEDLRSAVETLWSRDRRAFEVMDILIATRKKDKKMFADAHGRFREIHSLFSSVDGVMEFIEGTGLDFVFRHSKVKDLVDYVFGVETGLDSNARKNRSGGITERHVLNMLVASGVRFANQVSSTQFPKVGAVLGTDHKVFDFAIYAHDKIYLVEVNFYSSGGSKLNEVARSYQELSQKINATEGFEFVWITDGLGWLSAKNKLEEAFYSIPNVYNLTTISDFIASLSQNSSSK